MKIIHGTWIPSSTENFIQPGKFYIWIETSEISRKNPKKPNRHPRQLTIKGIANYLNLHLGITETANSSIINQIGTQYFLLPSKDNQPLPSLTLSRYLEPSDISTSELQYWAIDCFPLPSIIKNLNDFYFLAKLGGQEWKLGIDLLFWHYYTQNFKQIILKDRYIPALKYRQLTNKLTNKKKVKSKEEKSFEIYPFWSIISSFYQTTIQQSLEYMPLVCAAGFDEINENLTLYNRETLLHHFSEYLLNQIITNTDLPQVFTKKIENCKIIRDSLFSPHKPWINNSDLKTYQQWHSWLDKIIGSTNKTNFTLSFRLLEASEKDPDSWYLEFLVVSKEDPSLKLTLDNYWDLNRQTKELIQQQFGLEFEKNLLLNFGYAASIYPKLWLGLETDKPIGVDLNLTSAFEFLKEYAWILQDADYLVIVPAWWTPQGRQKAKIRLQGKLKKSSNSSSHDKKYFSLETIIEYQYTLAIGNQTVTIQEWQQLLKAKTPLVKFRGQWIELDYHQMQKMLEFWQKNAGESQEMTLLESLKTGADELDMFEVSHDSALQKIMAKLIDSQQLELIDNPPNFQGKLREYQKRGVSWLQYLEKLGLNGCLADDMGLGKTIQVIAHLIIEKNQNQTVLPTLLIAPTSVLGNWYKEVEKFGPNLKVMIHHGNNRIKDEKTFEGEVVNYDLVITSFNLARKDLKLLNKVIWQRIVLDEAQNIKNPKAAQTVAILKLKSNYKLALTGTPVENRLLDLWSIFNFLNGGYLGKQAQFKKSFEIPIQKNNDKTKSSILKKLVEPFILRRLKTDKDIIKDLPSKIEHKQYCNLTKEQASLYELVVKEVKVALDNAEGIKRSGLILSTLMRLKQICNHPRQFLQDNSEFTPKRSHKLERLGEMIEEVMAEGESLLIFSQFTEICESLQVYLKQSFYYNTYYLHGGTSRTKREQMIEEFQDDNTEPSVFILSLKAGGVGITLTKANHVFHFDRWWNPAVENQATDRAFRIGQKKNVFVHKFVTLGTLEEKIEQMIEDKKTIANSVVGSDESWLTQLNNERFLELITLNRKAIV